MVETTEAPAAKMAPITIDDNKVVLSLGNFLGGVGATGLVGFSVAMNQVMEGKPIKITGTEFPAYGNYNMFLCEAQSIHHDAVVIRLCYEDLR